MLRDNNGNRLYRAVDIKVYFPEKIFPTRHMKQHAPPHKGFSAENIDEILMNVTDKLDTLYPWWEFKLVEIKPEGRVAYYVFNWVGYRPSAFPAAQPQELEVSGMENQ